jgi:hypothetical protein
MKRYVTRMLATLAVPAAAGALLMAPATAVVTAARAPAAPVPCHASVSNSRPSARSTVYVNVSTARNASVRATARYSTGARTATGRANAQGRARLGYAIGSATRGRRVNVNVTVTSGMNRGSCSTSFTPR